MYYKKAMHLNSMLVNYFQNFNFPIKSVFFTFVFVKLLSNRLTVIHRLCKKLMDQKQSSTKSCVYTLSINTFI